MFSSVLISFLLVQSVTFSGVNCASCPTLGKVGASLVPDVTSLIKGQSGFTATVEIITPEEETIMVSDSYNDAKKFGQIQVNKLYNGIKTKIHYYIATNEKFAIENDACVSSKLDLLDKYTTIGTWLVPDEVLEEVTLFGDMAYLGPTILMVWARSVTDQAQFVGTETIDGRKVKHWFHCFNEKIWVDFWFDDKTDLPFRFSLSSASSSTPTDPHVYNFLIFNPMVTSTSDIVSYPVGAGCTRSITGLPEFPPFLKSDSFALEAEAMMSYSGPDTVTLSWARMMKYQNSYSFEISDSSNETTRIIQNPKHRGRYFVDVETGECTLDAIEYSEIQEDNLAIKWPFHYDAGFNLLQAVSSTSGAWSYYMGQVDTDAGLMDVWEDGLYSFFSSGSNVDAVVTYYFPAIDRTSKPHQSPTSIVIKPINSQYISMSAPLPYQVEIVILEYNEKTDLQLDDTFDISGCYDGPGEFTWFQIVASDINPSGVVKDATQIRSYFQQALDSFIPAIRLPEVVVNMYEFNYYITGKLLERPPFMFNYEIDPGYSIDNPTSILIRDSLEDCGEMCTNDLNCKEFSYCSDFTCQVFSSASSYSSVSEKENCNWYRRRSFNVGSTAIERNILASTRSILSQIKAKVNNGEFVMTKYSLSAEDMFIVSGPEEIGGIEEELKDDRVNPLKGDEYTVITPKSRLSSANGQSTINDISYSDCLKLCQNDDDCYTLSYCNDNHRECTLSTETKANLTKSIQDKTSHADNCNVFEKSFVAFYRKFPGLSLVKDSVSTLFDTDESECARVCYESTGIPCKSFDYCLQSTGTQGKSSQRACFLHEFHALEDTAHEISGKIWDFSTSNCDHYAVKQSRDYVHYIGRKYQTGKVNVIKEIADVSMERCATDCNQFDDDEDCVSFEYCESVEIRGSSNIRTTCRLSSSLTTGPNDLSSLDTTETTSTCSVYLNRDKVVKLSQFNGQDHFGLAIGLGSFFFLIAFMAGIVASVYYQRKFT